MLDRKFGFLLLIWSPAVVGGVAESVDVGAEGVGGDLAAASDVDGPDLAGGEEFVEFGAADAQYGGGLPDGVDEPLDRRRGDGGGRGFLLSVVGVGWLSARTSGAGVCLRAQARVSGRTSARTRARATCSGCGRASARG